MRDPHEVIHEELSQSYHLEDELGSGGMAVVYLARDRKHDRRVAIKVIRPELLTSIAPKRFAREVRITARLQHPHIVPLLESGMAGELPYYVTPYVEGESLRERIQQRGRLPVEEALQIARDVASALHYAHEQGIVHRDIKPENILIANEQAVVMDFGIARVFEGADETTLTESGSVVGTITYMSPEQLTAARKIDGRTDIYSLGCVLYEMLAGWPPFLGAAPGDVIRKQIFERPEPLPTKVPAAVRQAVMSALAKRPADRPQSVAEFVTALEAGATPESPVQGIRRYVTPGTATIAVLSLIVLAVFLLWLLG